MRKRNDHVSPVLQNKLQDEIQIRVTDSSTKMVQMWPLEKLVARIDPMRIVAQEYVDCGRVCK
jgi:hypothetical protein